MQQLHPRAIWLFFFNNVVLGAGAFLALAFACVGFVLARADDGVAFDFALPIMLVVFAAVVYLLAAYGWALLTVRFYRYELREDGFRKEHGVIWKKYITIPYDRIQNVDIHRGILARLLGLSDLQIQTAGAITAGSYGAFSEGRLPGIDRALAEEIRDQLVARVRGGTTQGL
ncbi:MAG TPA: PH domain-containing protein [Candidatus Paceibacterota bacterium]